MLLRAAVLLPAALITGLATAALSPRQTSEEEPCAQLASLYNGTHRLYPPELTLQCLRSVPLAKEDNAAQLAGLKQFVQFQSDLEYLRERPGGIFPSVDLLQSLDDLADRLENDEYSNEYDFQLDIYRLFQSAHDGHLSYLPDIVGVFAFMRPDDSESPDFSITTGDLNNTTALVSVSSEKLVTRAQPRRLITSLPEVYAQRDVAALLDPDSADYSPSAIEQINGDDVEAFLNAYALQNGLQSDLDSNYNSLFPSVPLQARGPQHGVFSYSRQYQGNVTQLSFENGTDLVIRNAAVLTAFWETQGLADIANGQDFFERFCTRDILNTTAQGTVVDSIFPTDNTTQVPYEPVSTEGVSPPSDAFPSPVVKAGDSSVAGYLPEDEPELAVLSISSFNPLEPVDFQNTVRQLLATANANNRTRLVIDLRGNAGGLIALATDTFRQLFPSEVPYSAGNYRAHDLFDFTGRTISEADDDVLDNVPDLSLDDNSTISGNSSQLVLSRDALGWIAYPFNYRYVLDVSNESFSSWEDLYGPQQTDGDNYTSLVRYNFTTSSSVQVPVYGFGNNTQPQPQTFEPENIVLLQDGLCASTCAIFSEMMKTQAGARSVAVGGRKQTGPMQGVGGTKGSSLGSMALLYTLVSVSATAASITEQLSLLTDYGTDEGNLLEISQQALNRHSAASAPAVNFENNIRRGDESLTPLQHVYEAADCRIFQTAEMLDDQAVLWTTTHDLMWGVGDAECVEGSTGQESATNGTDYFNASLPQGALNLFGGNETVFVNGSLGNGTFRASPSEDGDDEDGNDNGGDDGDRASESSSGEDDGGDENDAPRPYAPTVVTLSVVGVAAMLAL
ncbi:hypothetical protein MBLNU230_g0371t1 [Neophaeotheca triangularis]